MGLRVTDGKVIKIVENVMTELNKEIVIALEKKNVKQNQLQQKKIFVFMFNKKIKN